MENLTFDITAIRKKGGLRWAYKRVGDTGADFDVTQGQIFSVTVAGGGSGYTQGAAVSGTGGGGTGFAGTANVTAGAVTSVVVTNPGSGYTSLPTVVIAGGTGGTFTAAYADTWHDGVYRKASELGFAQPLESEELEDGSESLAELGKFESMFNITSAQDDAQTVKFLKDEAHLYTWAIALERGKGASNKTIEFFFPLCKIARTWNSKSGERKPVINIKYSYNAISITPATVPSWFNNINTAMAVAAEGYFSVAEAY